MRDLNSEEKITHKVEQIKPKSISLKIVLIAVVAAFVLGIVTGMEIQKARDQREV